MKTTNEILKIKATIQYILKSFANGVDYIKLFKIMYFAQQDHLVKYGKPIFNETFHALKHGPVPSFSYKCFQHLDGSRLSDRDVCEFAESFSVNEKKLIFSKEEPDMDELSKSNIRSLNEAIEKCKEIKSYDLSLISHDSAWSEAFTRSENDPEKDRISLIEIANAGGANVDVIECIRETELLKRDLSFC